MSHLKASVCQVSVNVNLEEAQVLQRLVHIVIFFDSTKFFVIIEDRLETTVENFIKLYSTLWKSKNTPDSGSECNSTKTKYTMRLLWWMERLWS